MTSSQRTFSKRKVVSYFEQWNEQPCVLFMPDLQELHWTNEPKAERICGCSRSRDTVKHSAGRYSEESSQIYSGINNISVKSCEKHSNSTQNSVKATDTRTNTTDVENRTTLFNKHKSPPFTMDLTNTGTACGRNGLNFFKCF